MTHATSERRGLAHAAFLERLAGESRETSLDAQLGQAALLALRLAYEEGLRAHRVTTDGVVECTTDDIVESIRTATRSDPPGSTQAMLPPPAPMLTRSMHGKRTGMVNSTFEPGCIRGSPR